VLIENMKVNLFFFEFVEYYFLIIAIWEFFL